MNNTSDFNELPITVTAEEIAAYDAMHLGMDVGVCQWDRMEEDAPEPDTVQSVSAFFALLRENTVKALSLSEMTTVTFPPFEETGKAFCEETATVTFRLPEFITTESGEREINLLFDFDKFAAHTGNM